MMIAMKKEGQMEFDRADSKQIDKRNRRALLNSFSITDKALLATGTEAEVYELDQFRVLKVYSNARLLNRLQTLRQFYDSIDDSQCGLKVPKISEVRIQGNTVGVVEARVGGVSLESLIPKLTGPQLITAENLYLTAAHSIRLIKAINTPQCYLLFDESGRSSTQSQSWTQFYSTLLSEKLSKVIPTLNRALRSFDNRAAELLGAFKSMPEPDLCLVHGDFFPGNVMVKPDLSAITGVIDFGSFTLFGDHVLDLAGALGFYRMYEKNRKEIRAQLLPQVLELLDSSEHQKLFMYLLSHAILTCDLYVTEPDPLDNGHLRWAVEILSDENYWREAI